MYPSVGWLPTTPVRCQRRDTDLPDLAAMDKQLQRSIRRPYAVLGALPGRSSSSTSP
jgi:hypothetical protein